MQELDIDKETTRRRHTVFLQLEEPFNSIYTITTLKISNIGILMRATSLILSERTASKSKEYWRRSDRRSSNGMRRMRVRRRG